jgi:ElaB/YqjD/DUF883 family membrane-anchored ribosome-binding protein
MSTFGIEDAAKAVNMDDVLKEATKWKTMVTEAVEDGVKSALRAVKQGRHRAEDAIDDARHVVRKNPVEAVGIAFAAGILTGALAAWITARSLRD